MSKNVKTRWLSLLLCAAMILALLPVGLVPVYAAGQKQILVGEDYTDWTAADGKLTKLTTGFPKPTQGTDNGNSYAKFANNWDRTGYTFAETVTGGTLNMKFDFSFDDVTSSTEPSMIGIGNQLHSDKYARLLLMLNRKGSDLYIANNTQAAGNKLGTIAANTWYTYEATINADTRAVVVTIKNRSTGVAINNSWDSTIALRNNHEYNNWPTASGNGTTQVNDLQQMIILGSVNLDNIEISRTIVVEDKSLPFVEDYSNWTTADEKLTKLTAGFPKPTQGTDNGNSYAKFANNWDRTGYEFEQVTDGILNMKFDFSFDDVTSSTEPSMIGLGNQLHSDKYARLLLMLNRKGSDLYIANNTQAAGNKLGTIAANTWYTYEATINVDTRAVVVTIKNRSTGAAINNSWDSTIALRNNHEYNNWPTASGNGTTQVNDLQQMIILGSVNLDNIEISRPRLTVSGVTYLDNAGMESEKASNRTKSVKISFSEAATAGTVKLDGTTVAGTLAADGKSYTIPVSGFVVDSTHTLNVSGFTSTSTSLTMNATDITFTVVDAGLLLKENYENLSDVTALTTFYEDTTNVPSMTITSQNGANYAKFNNSWARTGYEFREVTSGKLKVKFDFSYDDVESGHSFVRLGEDTGDKTKAPLVLLNRIGTTLKIANNNSNATTGNLTTGVTANTWYTYEAELNLDTQNAVVSIKTQGTNDVLGSFSGKINDRPSGDGGYNNWPASDSFKNLVVLGAVNLDNIEITQLFSRPTVTNKSVVLKKVNGETETDFNAVNPAVNCIDINFGENMDLATLDGKVTLTNTKTNQVLAFTGSLSGTVYTMSFGALAPEATYSLVVPETVANINGDTLGSEFTLPLKTIEGTVVGCFNSIKVGDTILTDQSGLSDLTDNAILTLNLSATNASGTGESMKATAYLAYYGENNKLLDVKLDDITVADLSTEVNQNITFTISKPAGTEYVKIFWWNDELNALCRHKEYK